MKKYAVVVDISPSEQLNDDDTELKYMALLFGLKSPTSFDEVGSNYPVENERYALRKWSNSSAAYKQGFIEHAKVLVNSGNILFGINVSSNAEIRDTGKRYCELIMGSIPEPENFSKKGRPKIPMGGYKVDGEIVPKWEILADDLYVLGWYSEALVNCLKSIAEYVGEDVKIDVIIDRLPNEQGGDKFHKATLLKMICDKGSNGLLTVVGVPEISDTTQRELLVDCLAGLCREIMADEDLPYHEAKKMFAIHRLND